MASTASSMNKKWHGLPVWAWAGLGTLAVAGIWYAYRQHKINAGQSAVTGAASAANTPAKAAKANRGPSPGAVAALEKGNQNQSDLAVLASVLAQQPSQAAGGGDGPTGIEKAPYVGEYLRGSGYALPATTRILQTKEGQRFAPVLDTEQEKGILTAGIPLYYQPTPGQVVQLAHPSMVAAGTPLYVPESALAAKRTPAPAGGGA